MAYTKKDEIATERYQLIVQLLDERLDQCALLELRRTIAKDSGYSEKTIRRYVDRYKKGGLIGLKPSDAGRPRASSIPDEVFFEAAYLRKANPRRSVGRIIEVLEVEGKIQKGEIKRSTLQERFAKAGLDLQQMKRASEALSSSGRRFQRKNRNDLWQSDCKYGAYINGQRTYLITFIDDRTRFVLDSRFYLSETTESVFDCFRRAITKYGTPKATYFDNGAAYRCNAMKRACAMLGTQKLHHKARCPSSKGKIEKFHQIVDTFLSELRLAPASSMRELNNRWEAYCELFYQNHAHAALEPAGTTPKAAYDSDATRLVTVAPAKLDDALLLFVVGRRVDKSGCVNHRGEKITADGLIRHVGKKVDVLWDASDRSKMWIEVDKVLRLDARPLEMKEWLPRRPKPANQPVSSVPEGSRVLDAATDSFRRKERARLAASGYVLQDDEPVPSVSVQSAREAAQESQEAAQESQEAAQESQEAAQESESLMKVRLAARGVELPDGRLVLPSSIEYAQHIQEAERREPDEPPRTTRPHAISFRSLVGAGKPAGEPADRPEPVTLLDALKKGEGDE
jgi:transposase InsO family protein